jgi:predicted AlkP superfamily pyrophosphatase or phosphodiesterase
MENGNDGPGLSRPRTRGWAAPSGSRVVRRAGDGHSSPSGMFRRFSVAAALYLAFASCMAFTTARVLHARSQSTVILSSALPAPTANQPKYLVLMVLDGARPDYFTSTALPHFQQLADAGTQFSAGIDGLLEAETPSAHTALATGSRPDHNGILGFDWANTDNDRYSLFDPNKMTDMEQIIQDNHAPTIAGLYKQQFPGSVAVSMSGSKYYAAAPLGGPNADAIIYYGGVCVQPGSNNSCNQSWFEPFAVPGHVPPQSLLKDPSLTVHTTKLASGQEDHAVTTMALATVSQMHPRLLLMNYPEFDWPLGHVFGGSIDQSLVQTDMRDWDNDLGQIEDLYRKEGILNQTLFVITADHGMMPIERWVPATTIENAVAAAGTTSPDIASNSGDFVWLADPTKAQTVADNIMNAKDPGIMCAYYLGGSATQPAYSPSSGCNVTPAIEAANQYLLSALLNGHEPQVVVLGNEGVSFSNPTTTHWKGDHGGASWESQHFPLILAGPGIKQGVTIDSPVQTEDIAPTVLTDMGVTPTGMDGTTLADALQQPTDAQTRARNNEITWLTPIEQALSTEVPMSPSSS